MRMLPHGVSQLDGRGVCAHILLTSTLVASRRRLAERRDVTSVMAVISTLLASTPAADATPAIKDACEVESNSAAESGSDTTISTYLVLGSGLGFGVKGFDGLVGWW